MTPGTGPKSQRQFIHRIHRIQGQLTGLQKGIEEARHIEQLITQARAIEKAVASLNVEMIEDHLVDHICEMPNGNREQTVETLVKLIALAHR